MSFGENLQTIRKKNQLSQEKLAEIFEHRGCILYSAIQRKM